MEGQWQIAYVEIAKAAVTLRALRQESMRKLNYSLPPRAIFRLVFSV